MHMLELLESESSRSKKAQVTQITKQVYLNSGDPWSADDGGELRMFPEGGLPNLSTLRFFAYYAVASGL